MEDELEDNAKGFALSGTFVKMMTACHAVCSMTFVLRAMLQCTLKKVELTLQWCDATFVICLPALQTPNLQMCSNPWLAAGHCDFYHFLLAVVWEPGFLASVASFFLVWRGKEYQFPWESVHHSGGQYTHCKPAACCTLVLNMVMILYTQEHLCTAGIVTISNHSAEWSNEF